MPACTHICHNTFSIIMVKYFFPWHACTVYDSLRRALNTATGENPQVYTKKEKTLFSQILQKFDNSYLHFNNTSSPCLTHRLRSTAASCRAQTIFVFFFYLFCLDNCLKYIAIKVRRLIAENHPLRFSCVSWCFFLWHSFSDMILYTTEN